MKVTKLLQLVRDPTVWVILSQQLLLLFIVVMFPVLSIWIATDPNTSWEDAISWIIGIGMFSVILFIETMHEISYQLWLGHFNRFFFWRE